MEEQVNDQEAIPQVETSVVEEQVEEAVAEKPQQEYTLQMVVDELKFGQFIKTLSNDIALLKSDPPYALSAVQDAHVAEKFLPLLN